MRYSIAILTSLILAPLATAFTLPSGANEGSYVAYYDENGNQVHVKSPTVEEQAILATKAYPPPEHLNSTTETTLETRDIQWIWCGCGHNLDPNDCDNAVAGLKSQFDPQASIDAYMAWYTIRGSVVAFACNTVSSTSDSFAPQYLDLSYSVITETCGWYVAGTWFAVLQVNIGYMNYYGGLDFCAASQGSSADHC